jgi:RsiW-degrading membrane proteinase PrsW (M82 family)
MKHSRIFFLFSVSFACVALNFWLIKAGHYRLPLAVFVGAVALIVLAFRKLPQPPVPPDEIQRNLLKTATGLRRLGFIGVVGFVVSILSFSRDEFKGLPDWGVVIAFLWGGFVVWCYFWGARWCKRKAEELSAGMKRDLGK